MNLLCVNDEMIKLILTFLKPEEIMRLGFCNKYLYEFVTLKCESIWRNIYEKNHVGLIPMAPHIQGCGSWKDIVVRARENKIRINVRLLGCDNVVLALSIPRTTTLIELKKMIRKRQLFEYGVELGDFELINVKSEMELGVRGFDNFPRSDISRFFLSNETQDASSTRSRILRRMLSSQTIRSWNRRLSLESDGIELQQRFTGLVHKEELTNFEFMVHQYVSTGGSNREQWQRIGEILDQCDHINIHKLYWSSDHWFHPLLFIASSRGVALRARLLALAKFCTLFLSYLLSKDFIAQSVSRAFFQSGFLASFSRFFASIAPHIFQTKLRSIMQGEVELVPIVFALRLLSKFSISAIKALLPMLQIAVFHQAFLAMLRMFVHCEHAYDEFVVFISWFLLGFHRYKSGLHMWVPRAIIDACNAEMTHSNRYVDGIIRFIQRRMPGMYYAYHKILHQRPYVQYVWSSVVWKCMQHGFSDKFLVSLVLYSYSFPPVIAMILIRFRMLVSDSYFYLLSV